MSGHNEKLTGSKLLHIRRKSFKRPIFVATLLVTYYFVFGATSPLTNWRLHRFSKPDIPPLDPLLLENVANERVILPPIASHITLERYGVLEDFIAYGTLSKDQVDLSAYNRIDGVWLWVNGSDPRHALSRAFYAHAPVGFSVSPFEESKVVDKRLWPDEDATMEFSEQESTPDEQTDDDGKPAKDPVRQTDVDGALSRKQLQNTNNRFRDNGELQYALRSARLWLQDSLRTQHLITTDFWTGGYPHPTAFANSTFGLLKYEEVLDEWRASHSNETTPGDSSFSTTFSADHRGLLRRGQYPQWIKDRVSRQIVVHHDWTMALPLRLLRDGGASRNLSEAVFQWRQKVVPTFNSMSAETVLGVNLPELTDTFFYSNDDMFFNGPMTASDFGTPLFGPVLRLNSEVMIVPEQFPEEGLGEGPSLFWSNWLISQRFGTRERAWFHHYQKAYSRATLFESRMLWADEFDAGAMRRFRKGGVGPNSHFLTYHFMIERHREALLWSFFVLRFDRGCKGWYDDEEVALALREMGTTEENNGIVDVLMPQRGSLNRIESDLANGGLYPPKSTEYLFTSMDGTANARMPQEEPDTPWPDFSSSKRRTACRLDTSACWPAGERDSSRIFRRFAFEKPEECGDCLIVYLLGKRIDGLHTFLPSKDARLPKLESGGKRKPLRHKQPPHLPLTKSFKHANFTAQHVADHTGWHGQSMRTFAVTLIHRYSYVIGSTKSFYWSLKTPQNVREGLQGIRTLSTNIKTRPALICLNDDLAKGASARRKVHHLLHEWYEEFFPQRLSYE